MATAVGAPSSTLISVDETSPLLVEGGEDGYTQVAPDPSASQPPLARSILDASMGREDASQPLEEGPSCLGRGTVGSAVFNLTNSIIGTGIMGLPATLKVLGVPFGLLTLSFMGFVTDFSLRKLLHCTTASKAPSFFSLMHLAYGNFGGLLLRINIILNNSGVLIVCLIILGDVISGSDSLGVHYPGLLEEWTGHSAWWTSRAVVLPAITAFVLGPLCALPRIDSLGDASGLSILLAVAFVLVTLALALLAFVGGHIDWTDIQILPRAISSAEDVWVYFSIIPTMATAFVCHFNLHPILLELQPPQEGKMRTTISWSLGLSTAMYCITALSGYLLFGSNTYEDVLANFSGGLSPVVNNAVRILYATHLLLAFPVLHYTLRHTVGRLIFPNTLPLVSSPFKFAFVTILLVGTILLLSLVMPNIQFAFKLLGSAGAATLSFTVVGLVALSPKTRLSNLKLDVGGVALLVFGLLITMTGLSGNIHDLL